MKIQIADNIRDLRKARDMMQEQLAEALGVSAAAVSKWERDAAVPELSYILEMADLFGVSVDALVGYRIRSGAADDLAERIHALQREKNYPEAAAEAEKPWCAIPTTFAWCSAAARCTSSWGWKPRTAGRWNGRWSY